MVTQKMVGQTKFSPLFWCCCCYPGWIKIKIRDKHPGTTTLDNSTTTGTKFAKGKFLSVNCMIKK